MNLLDRGSAFLDRKLGAAGSVPVVYARGPVAVPVLAVPGVQRADARQTTPPARIDYTERDYVITVAALQAAGIDGTPEVGDRITETINGRAWTFEVKRRDAEPAWRYSDAGRSAYRVHTKAAE